MELAGINTSNYVPKQLNENTKPSGLGVIDYDDDDGFNYEDFKLFHKKITAINTELNDDYADEWRDIQREQPKTEEIRKLIREVIGGKNDYDEGYENEDPYKMELALINLKQRYNDIRRYLQLKDV
jgi:hypothetical protein